jgi:hypothetical protein
MTALVTVGGAVANGGLHQSSLILCTAVALNIFSAPAGSTVVGEVPASQRVYLMDSSLLRDWVFIGKPNPDGVSPRGWIIYNQLGACPRAHGVEIPPTAPEPEEAQGSDTAKGPAR